MVSQSFHILVRVSLMPLSRTAWFITAVTRRLIFLYARALTGVISWAVLIWLTTRTGPRSSLASRMSKSSSSTRMGAVTGMRVPSRFTFT